ncbi:MAG: enoyl-CoA hydratase/isomerase family protein [Chlamydiae bacterium]|nr:enoyl-CoA hydratase/isomerase family protein [Chlamydiota bacterium]
MAIPPIPLKEVLRQELDTAGHCLKEYDLGVFTRLVEKYNPSDISIEVTEIGEKIFKCSNETITFWKKFPTLYDIADRIEKTPKANPASDPETIATMLDQVTKIESFVRPPLVVTPTE